MLVEIPAPSITCPTPAARLSSSPHDERFLLPALAGCRCSAIVRVTRARNRRSRRARHSGH